MRPTAPLIALTMLTLTFTAFGQEPKVATPAAQAGAKAEAKAEGKPDGDKVAWNSLLPDKGIEGWVVSDFGGEGKVERQGDHLILNSGDPLTGITYEKKDFPKDNFEIELEAQRIDGSDFLCGLTFPVGDEFCSFIAGGWGGGVVGLSNVDGYDASENSTSLYYAFDNAKWYTFRLRVDPEFITGWINDKEVIKQERERHEFSTRIEVYVSQPLGLCAFKSKVDVRNFRWRPLKGNENSKAKENLKANKDK